MTSNRSNTRRRPGKKHPWVGQTIGGLAFTSELGRGRSATVLLAHQEPEGKPVAVKVLSEEFSKESRHVSSFIEEARRAARLKHENILKIYRVAKYRELYFIVLEFAAGGTVENLLKKEGRIHLKRAISIITDAARGLGYAASEGGVVHRDVKPANLLIGEDETVKVADFGIAGHTGECTNEGGTIYGSPLYIAPEQARGEPASSLSDIYSLGITFYEILTGRTPFRGAGAGALILAHLNERPTPVNRIIPTIPKRVAEVVDVMTEKDPCDRYQSFDEVLDELEELRNLKTFDNLRLGERRRKG